MLSYVISDVTNSADLAWCPGTKDVLGPLRPCNLMIKLTPTRPAVQRTKDREAKGIVTTIQTGRGELRCDTSVEGEVPPDDSVAAPLAVEAVTKTLSADDLILYEEY